MIENLDELWSYIDDAPGYKVSSRGRVKYYNGIDSVRVRRSWFGRSYVNLIVHGKVKRFYIDSLVARHFW
jgi:hypothetical protein